MKRATKPMLDFKSFRPAANVLADIKLNAHDFQRTDDRYSREYGVVRRLILLYGRRNTFSVKVNQKLTSSPIYLC